MRVLGKIPAGASPPLRAGTLRRRDLDAFGALLGELRDAGVIAVAGDRSRRRAAAVGLAATAAASGTRTALLECDLAGPGLAEALGLAIAPGLREHLRGEAEADRILKPVALAGPGSASAREPLVCVVAGRPGADGATLLASAAFGAAIASLRAAYELVVIDAPSSDGDAEPLVTVASQTDATVLCLGLAEEAPSLPLALAGVILQEDEPQRS